jgi:NhaP-type Na+/H+ or K+/H+ antiporter
MHTLTQTFRYSVIHGGRRTSRWSINFEQILDMSFNLIEFFGDCLIGLLIGAIAGWISGWCIGHLYSELYTPVHFISFEVVNKWYLLPYEYAGYGIHVGAVLGIGAVLVTTIIKAIRKNQQENTEVVES